MATASEEMHKEYVEQAAKNIVNKPPLLLEKDFDYE